MPNSIDFSQVKAVAIPEGDVIRIELSGTVLWQKKTFKNQVPISTDTDGSIFNGAGYKENARLSSSGGISGSAQNGSVTTGFIPFKQTDGKLDVIRMKGVEWLGATSKYGGHFYINCYDSNKKFLDYLASAELNTYAHIVTVTRNSAGVETVQFNDSYGTSNAKLQYFRKASFIRITARGKGADMIVTINEEI